MDRNRQWRLRRRPVGDISEGDLELVSSPVPVPGAGEILVRNIYLSLDPTNRIWMSDQEQYMPPVGIGEVMRGGTLGVVEASNHPDFAIGECVRPFPRQPVYVEFIFNLLEAFRSPLLFVSPLVISGFS